MTGGEFFRAEVSADGMFERLGREMSGLLPRRASRRRGRILDGKDGR
jgi:hypothetical protein